MDQLTLRFRDRAKTSLQQLLTRVMPPAPISALPQSPVTSGTRGVFSVAANSAGNPVDVLKNDFGIDTAGLTLISIGAARYGTALISGGIVLYSPAKDFQGADFFVYTVMDAQFGQAQGTVSIVVGGSPSISSTPPPPAPTPMATTAPPPTPHPLQAAINTGLPLTQPVYARQMGVVTRHSFLRGLSINGARPVLRFMGSAEEKGGLLVKGADLTVENLELWDAASASSGNGAGIRFEPANGTACNITVRDSAFRYCENGILGPDNELGGGVLTIERCEFDRNGRFGSGQEHGIYIGPAAHLIVNDSYFHDTYTGHELKSRAKKSTLTNSRFGSVTSRASYEAEFPDGGDVSITGCTFIQSPGTDNDFMLGFGAEWVQARAHPVNRMIVRNCVFWNFKADGYVVRVNLAVPAAQIEFHNCTFINFTNTWAVQYAPATVAAMGTGNRVLTLAQGIAEYPNAPALPAAQNVPQISIADAKAGNLPVRQWREVAGTRIDEGLDLTAINPFNGYSPAAQARNIIDAWGGCTLRGNEAVLHGTGHSDGAITARAAFDFKAFTWRWATPQSAPQVVGLLSPDNSYWPRDTAQPWFTRAVTPEESNKNTFKVAGVDRVLTGQLPDGNPAIWHGWTNAFTLPDGRFGTFNKTWDIPLFDPATGKWTFTRFPNVYTENYSVRAHVDTVTNTVYALTADFKIFEFDASNLGFKTSRTIARAPSHSCIVGREIWYFSGGHGDTILQFDMDTKAVTESRLDYPLAHQGMQFDDSTGCVYDPAVGVIRMDRLGALWSVDVSTKTCSKFAGVEGAPMPRNGIWSRFFVRDSVLYALPAGDRGVHAMKL